MANPPAPAQMLPSEIIHDALPLPHKPGAYMHYSLARSHDPAPPVPNPTSNTVAPVLIVFLNGLMTDKSSWLPVMAGIIRQRKGTSMSWPTLLAYDRYGQGLTTDRDPQDTNHEPGRGHDVSDAVVDLRQLILQICKTEEELGGEETRIVLVANSIGCAIGRLYAEEYPCAALLLLDSIIANSNFDFWPDPDDAGFDPAEQLPEDVSVEVLREQRAKFAKIFSPEVPNREGLDRRNLWRLLPYSDQPMLGKEGKRPWVTVVGHDFQKFAEESEIVSDNPLSSLCMG